MIKTHVIKLPERSGIVTVDEQKDKILVKIRFDKYGDFGDVPQLMKWLEPIFMAFEEDPRPIEMDNPTTGEQATVYGDSSNSIIVVNPKPEDDK